jgi:hypothetical protein
MSTKFLRAAIKVECHIRTLNVRIIQNDCREREYVVADWIALMEPEGF